ncbi:MAG: hypothetical protein Q8M65_01425, partial [Rhodoglobus sp.]|nr:hypothetical protein [Rhodoglobus sp.]
MLRDRVSLTILTLAALVLGGCTADPAPTSAPPVGGSGEHPIQIVDGGFVNVRTGEPFPVRGTNYFTIVPTSDGLEDRFFSPSVFDSAEVTSDFQALAERGYTTVRLFLDTCGVGPDCISQVGVDGLNPAYLDSIAETMRIAVETGLFLVLTSNDIPDGGGYSVIADRADPEFFPGYRNTVFLTTAGAEAAAASWDDLLTGLSVLDAPFEAVLAWS